MACLVAPVMLHLPLRVQQVKNPCPSVSYRLTQIPLSLFNRTS